MFAAPAPPAQGAPPPVPPWSWLCQATGGVPLGAEAHGSKPAHPGLDGLEELPTLAATPGAVWLRGLQILPRASLGGMPKRLRYAVAKLAALL
ncbi:hypothetical protein ACINB_22400 [Acidovorax sp. NB1]|nr:hypothetical protein ACINB_22400 [Acidovorax sp. NB1]